MIIYHGTHCEIQKPMILSSRFTKDFGPGFYCTALKEQAIRWAKRSDSPKLNVYEFDPDSSDLSILNFEQMSENWLDFIVRCRNGENHHHDIVIGAMANDQVYNYVNDFIEGILTREQFWVLAKFKHPTHQICFCNEKALSRLTFKECENL